jgi:hypothetical protein
MTLTLEGGEVKEATWTRPDEFTKWFRESSHAILVITEMEESSRPIAHLIARSAHKELLSIIEGATMKSIRVIRNVGVVPELPESLPDDKPLEEILCSWRPEVSSDGVTWAKVPLPVSESKYSGLFRFTGRVGFSSKAELDVAYWGRIKEVLEDNLDIAPEDEFLTNTIGHLRTRNFRLAIVDAVIGLEIVLGKYLRSYLAIAKKMPNARINAFLQNDFGLTQRLEGLLDLTMHESYLRDVKLDQVLKAVKWRNHIVHKSGNLPADIPLVMVREHIFAVLGLARVLAELHVDISAFPDRGKIGEKLKANWSGRIGWPNLWIKPWHKVYAEVACGIGPPLTSEEMKAIAEELGGYLKARDKRFDPNIHLHVYFKNFLAGTIGSYENGRVFLEGESPLKSFPAGTSRSASTTTLPSSHGSSGVSAT